MSSQNGPKPPKTLKKAGRKHWKLILKDYLLEEEHHLKLLELASSCVDQIAEDEKLLQETGPYFVDRFNQPKERPESKRIKDNKVLYCRVMRELNLDIEPPKENRPPALYGD